MNAITSFYKILDSKGSKLNDNALLKERLEIINSANILNILRINSKGFNKNFYNDQIFINKVQYNTINVKVNKSIYHKENSKDKSIKNFSFCDNIAFGYLKNNLTTNDTEVSTINKSSKFKFFVDEDSISNNTETSDPNKVNIYSYSFNSNSNLNDLNDSLFIEILDLANTKFDYLNNPNKIFYEKHDNTDDDFKFGLVEDENKIQRENQDIYAYNENERYNLYFKNNIREGKIGENILLFGDGENNIIEYWESENASDGIHFVYDENNSIISIISNEIFETVSIVGGIQSGNY